MPAEAGIPDGSCLGQTTGIKGIEAVCNSSLEHVRGQPPQQEGGEMPSRLGNQRRKRVVDTDPMGDHMLTLTFDGRDQRSRLDTLVVLL